MGLVGKLETLDAIHALYTVYATVTHCLGGTNMRHWAASITFQP